MASYLLIRKSLLVSFLSLGKRVWCSIRTLCFYPWGINMYTRGHCKLSHRSIQLLSAHRHPLYQCFYLSSGKTWTWRGLHRLSISSEGVSPTFRWP